jgi:hypothetical protein
MSSLAEHIANQLNEEGVDVSTEQIQSHMDSYVEEPAPKAKAGKKVVAKSKASKEPEVHTCERTINGKDGSRICGKNAANELNDMWFCGTEKSGCYKTAMSKSAPAPKAKAAKGKAAPVAKAKASNVIQKVQKKERLNLVEVPQGSGIWVDLVHFRMVYSQDPKETYGILDEDDETILPLTEEAVAFAEAHNVPIREVKKAAKSKVVAKAKVVPKGKVVAEKVVAKVAPKAKVVAKGKVVAEKVVAKVAPKSKVVAKAKAAPKGKVTAKTSKKDEELLEDLQNEAEDVETEPNVEEDEDVPVEEEEAPEIDLGDGEEPEPVGEGEEEDAPDVEEVDEGEAADEEEVEEEEDVEDEGDDE